VSLEDFKPEDSYTARNGYINWKIGGKWNAAHRFIMEAMVGRRLYPGERVSFKDGNKENLSPDNLRLVSTGKTKAERVAYLEGVIEAATEELANLQAQ
jgi:hypothetical protein